MEGKGISDFMKNKLTAIDLFCGAGGLSKGFEKAGFKILIANDNWHPAIETFRMNHPDAIIIEGDITDTEIKDRIIELADRKVDVIIGGPPCQAYSMAGKRDPTDPRGKMFEHYVEIVNAIKPQFFIMENVKGMLSMMHDRDDLSETERRKVQEIRERIQEMQEIIKRNKVSESAKKDYRKRIAQLRNEMRNYQEKVTDMLIGRFNKIGYDVKFKVLNAADYGTPQKRERVIFIGTKTGKRIVFPEPTHSENPQPTLDGKGLKKWKTIKEVIDDLKNAPENPKLHHIYPVHNPEFLEKIKKTPIGMSVFKNYSDAFFRCPPNQPSRTVKENHNGVFVHYEKNRVMTPRELARLQDFDDDFLFFGSKSIVLKQIGNAVPVKLAKAIGEHMKKLIYED